MRLIQLAEHLESGKLAHGSFDFAQYNYFTSDYAEPNMCGTAGCALGECPAIWPEEWEWWYNNVGLAKSQAKGIWAAIEWFGISAGAAQHLFYPECQIPSEYGGVWLSTNATAEEVASNIREFVKRQQ